MVAYGKQTNSSKDVHMWVMSASVYIMVNLAVSAHSCVSVATHVTVRDAHLTR